MGKSLIMVGLCLFVACTLFVEEVTSVCCYASHDCNESAGCRKCDDGSPKTPYCGVGDCNIVGCNCDGGCRKAGRGLELPEAIDGFAKIDANGDGKVSLEEAKSLYNSTGRYWKPETHIEFARMDVDSDGFLSKEEVDPVAKA